MELRFIRQVQHLSLEPCGNVCGPPRCQGVLAHGQPLITAAASRPAKHSPRRARDSGQANPPPSSVGNIYPLDDVVAVIDDPESAERAVRSLRDAGLAEDDVDLLDGPSAVEAARSFRQHGGRLRRVQAWLSEAFSDDGEYARIYEREAERGHYLVIAHAAGPEVVESVRQVLHAHGGHSMRHFELLTVTDLW